MKSVEFYKTWNTYLSCVGRIFLHEMNILTNGIMYTAYIHQHKKSLGKSNRVQVNEAYLCI